MPITLGELAPFVQSPDRSSILSGIISGRQTDIQDRSQKASQRYQEELARQEWARQAEVQRQALFEEAQKRIDTNRAGQLHKAKFLDAARQAAESGNELLAEGYLRLAGMMGPEATGVPPMAAPAQQTMATPAVTAQSPFAPPVGMFPSASPPSASPPSAGLEKLMTAPVEARAPETMGLKGALQGTANVLAGKPSPELDQWAEREGLAPTGSAPRTPDPMELGVGPEMSDQPLASAELERAVDEVLGRVQSSDGFIIQSPREAPEWVRKIGGKPGSIHSAEGDIIQLPGARDDGIIIQETENQKWLDKAISSFVAGSSEFSPQDVSEIGRAVTEHGAAEQEARRAEAPPLVGAPGGLAQYGLAGTFGRNAQSLVSTMEKFAGGEKFYPDIAKQVADMAGEDVLRVAGGDTLKAAEMLFDIYQKAVAAQASKKRGGGGGRRGLGFGERTRLHNSVMTIITAERLQQPLAATNQIIETSTRLGDMVNSSNPLAQGGAIAEAVKSMFGTRSTDKELDFVLNSTGRFNAIHRWANQWTEGGQIPESVLRSLREFQRASYARGVTARRKFALQTYDAVQRSIIPFEDDGPDTREKAARFGYYLVSGEDYAREEGEAPESEAEEREPRPALTFEAAPKKAPAAPKEPKPKAPGVSGPSSGDRMTVGGRKLVF